jgi:hypothetical protein
MLSLVRNLDPLPATLVFWSERTIFANGTNAAPQRKLRGFRSCALPAVRDPTLSPA